MKKIVLTGGGTAGHVIPHISILKDLKKIFDKIYYIGMEKGIEKKIISEHKEIKFINLEAPKFLRKLTLKNLLIPFKLISSINKAKKILKEINPDVVFSKGGYISVPVVIAAKKLKIKVVSHESDFTMGLANKIIYKYCDKMCVSFNNRLAEKKKCIYTGTPIRPSIYNGNKTKIKNYDKLTKSKKTVLFFGGSLGSKAINDCVENSINKLTKEFNVLHITGKDKINNITIKNYIQLEFTNTIENYFDAADVIVTRGGANSLFEIFALKKPALIIPLPKDESRGDQIDNANYFFKHGCANVLEQKNLNTRNLINQINKTLKRKDYYRKNILHLKMKDANAQIINQILN